MKYYVQFLAYNLKHNLVDACGSDGVMPLDGRLSLANMIKEAHIQQYRLKRVAHFDGFAIIRGTSFSNSAPNKILHRELTS